MEKLDIAIVASKQDAAGLNICRQMRQIAGFPALISGKRVEIFLRDEEAINCENIDKQVDAEAFVFASKHVSRAQVHSLTVHSIGNWGKATAGGRDRELAPAPAAMMKACYKLLMEKAEKAGLGYEVIQEATHHGPYMEKPAMFVEIGSDEERWNDEKAGRAVAESILEAIKTYSNENVKASVGIGGMHHSPNFRKAMAGDDYAVSYICPKHMLGFLDEEMLMQAIQKSEPAAELALLDWKGMGKEKERIKGLLDSMGMSYDRTNRL